MQKYLLLLVCLIATMNARAGITVVPPEETESDYYLLTLSGTVTTPDWINLSDHVKNAKSLKIVTKDGYKLKTSDMTLLMGNTQNSLFKDHLESLDMGDAELDNYSDLALMTNATESTGLIHLKYFVFPKNIEEIPNNPKGMFEDNKVIEEVIMLERDDTNKSGFTTIPANTFKNASNLSKVRIPEGVTTIGPSAFAGTESEPGPPLETIHFPNSLKRIENSAFAYNHALKSVTVPANVKFIGNSAFQRNDNLEDVYVLGDHVEIEDGSFNEEYTYDGFTYDNTNDGSEIISIKDWKSSKNYVKHPVRLHIPKNSDAYVYCVNPFLRALNELNDDDFNNLYTESVKTKLRAYGIDCEPYMFERNYWVEMDGHKYFKEPGAMFNEDSYLQGILKETVGYGSPKYTPFNGWHNFMFAAGDLEEKTWPDKRMIESRWYSAVFPFNLSYNQLMTAYGNGTDVREFTGVERSTNSDGKTVLKITFNDCAVVPVDHDANENGNTYIVKGHPYMIHPGVRSVPVGEGETAVYRTIAGVSVEEANNVISTEQPLTVTGDLKEGNAIIKANAYTFVGTYKEEGDVLPKHCYYLGMYTGKPETLGFYYTKTAGTTKKNWKQFTSIVIVSNELEDAGAKFMDMDFSVINHDVFNDDYGIATGITNTSIEQVGTSIIYNLNGQVVGKGSLQGMSKGIYVVNGKKIVVR
ncbi:MAG: leucine-rich repeat domain-containing protein [Prevotella sp.]|nr:leucine-rich repeat domain-containing protein [Prevotella sp.]